MLIKDKKIDRISGPVSFALLKPKKFIFDELKKEGVHLPIFMLFGDVHFSGKYQCEKCTCEGSSSAFGSSSAGCCMPIYSNEFLRLIDSMATKKHPIDFGIEGFYAGEERKYVATEYNILAFKEVARRSEMQPMKMLRDNNIACYIKELRGTSLYSKYCPTKNIRWHFMDARSAGGSKYDLENLLIELDLPDTDNNLNELFETELSKSKIKHIIDRQKSKFKDKTMFYKLIMLKYYISTSPEKAIDYFFTIATPQNSLIIKQFSKLSKSLKDLEFWKKSMSDYFLHISRPLNKDANIVKSKFYGLIIRDDIDELSELLRDIKNRNLLKQGSSFSIRENTIFMDMYYIFRTFKIPKGDRNPYLSLIHIGDRHRENITFFLANIIKYYDIVKEVNIKGDVIFKDDPQMRCTLMPNIDFNDLALQYGIDIKSLNPYVAPYVAPPVIRGSGGAKAGGRRSPVRRASRGGRRRSPVRRYSGGGRRRTPVRKASRGGRKRTPVRRASRGGRKRTPVRRASRGGRKRTPVRRASRGGRRRTPVRKSAGRRRR